MSGSKPLALHTEFAKESAQWDKPYGAGTDIVFYLERADSGSGEGGELPTSEDSMMKAMENSGFDSDNSYLSDGDLLAIGGGFIDSEVA